MIALPALTGIATWNSRGASKTVTRDAFMRLFQSLLPQLQQTTAWPDPEDFPYVERQWFPQSKRVGFEFFYLARRLQKEYPKRPDWKEIIGYHVGPVKIPAGGRASGHSNSSLRLSCI